MVPTILKTICNNKITLYLSQVILLWLKEHIQLSFFFITNYTITISRTTLSSWFYCREISCSYTGKVNMFVTTVAKKMAFTQGRLNQVSIQCIDTIIIIICYASR